MNQAALEAVITQYCKELSLTAASLEFQSLCRQARDEQWPYEEFLHEFLERELQKRRQNSVQRKLKQADFPDVKTFEQLDWQALQGISRPKILELSSCEYIARREDIVLVGPIGTGKTHLAISLGVEAAKRRLQVRFTRAADLVRQLHEARDERALGRLHKSYQSVSLLIIDELGFIPFDKIEGELLFNLLSERYERRSTIVTSNLAFGEWVQVFGSEKMTTALLDRLVHHAHVLTTKGKSYRTIRQQELAKRERPDNKEEGKSDLPTAAAKHPE